MSSATLPHQDSIRPCIQYHRVKFPNTEIYSISSYECKKGIPIIDSRGYYILPHIQYATFADIQHSICHLEQCKTILRHFDLNEIVRFILYINKQKWLRPRFHMDNYYESPLDIDVMSLKEY